MCSIYIIQKTQFLAKKRGWSCKFVKKKLAMLQFYWYYIYR